MTNGFVTFLYICLGKPLPKLIFHKGYMFGWQERDLVRCVFFVGSTVNNPTNHFHKIGWLCQDRILVPESATSCGDVSTAHDLAFRMFLCGRGDATCVSTAGNGPPTSYENMGHIVGHMAEFLEVRLGEYAWQVGCSRHRRSLT